MTDEQPPPAAEGAVGRGMTYAGVVMLATSFLLGFVDVGGAGFHNLLQFGGIGALLIGYVVWKVLKI